MQDKEKAFIQATILFSKASNLNIYVRFCQRDNSYLTEQKSVWHKYLKPNILDGWGNKKLFSHQKH